MYMEQHDTNTVIIGAGAAGLATRACLRRAGVPCIVLEQHDQVGATWRRHYDRLRLHTDKAHSALPFLAFPAEVPRYPSRLQVVRYLEQYAETFQISPLFGREVVSVRRTQDGWETTTREERYMSPHVVIATGYAREPVAPTWPGQDSFSGVLMHSSQYRNGRPFSDQRVLVVGFGNSGGEIAIDLCEHGARVSISVRSAVNVIPRELLGIPILAIAALATKLPARVADALTAPILHLMYGDLSRFGLRKLPYGPLQQIEQDARIPLIDIGTMELIERGRVRVEAGIDHFDGGEVCFVGGRRAPFDAVIMATGYRPRVSHFLVDADDVCDDEGTPHCSGAEAVPGLFFCGFYVSPRGMLGAIGEEARQIADTISRRRATTG